MAVGSSVMTHFATMYACLPYPYRYSLAKVKRVGDDTFCDPFIHKILQNQPMMLLFMEDANFVRSIE